jgi:DNA invertase Pin-like site-specific DNA recombinase
VSKVDRLTRSFPFLSRLLEAAVDVRFADLPQVEVAKNDFMLQQMAAEAGLAAGMISKRTRDALATARRKGKRLGGYRGVRPSPKTRAKAVGAVEARASSSAAPCSKRTNMFSARSLMYCAFVAP